MKHRTLPATSIAPNNGWLEYYFPIGGGQLQSEPPNNGKQHPDVVISGGDEMGGHHQHPTCWGTPMPHVVENCPNADATLLWHAFPTSHRHCPAFDAKEWTNHGLTLSLVLYIYIPWKSKNEQRMVRIPRYWWAKFSLWTSCRNIEIRYTWVLEPITSHQSHFPSCLYFLSKWCWRHMELVKNGKWQLVDPRHAFQEQLNWQWSCLVMDKWCEIVKENRKS